MGGYAPKTHKLIEVSDSKTISDVLVNLFFAAEAVNRYRLLTGSIHDSPAQSHSD
jgi:hypothetical protein